MAAPELCPSCFSHLLQPMRAEPHEGGGLLIHMRCPECFACFEATLKERDWRELDRAHNENRAVLVAAYERSVSESMNALASCFSQALERDLLGADDFAPRRAA